MKTSLIFRCFLFLSMTVLVACQSAPTRFDNKPKGLWASKVLVKDKQNGRSYLLHLKLQADDQKNMRVDISTTLGQPVAALVLKGNNVRYILMESKRVYSGPASTESLKPILSAPIDPRWLMNIFYEKPFEEKSWQCAMEKDFLKDCRHLPTNTVVRWSERVAVRRMIHLEHKRADLQIQILSFTEKTDDRADIFEIKTPEGFREIKLK